LLPQARQLLTVSETEARAWQLPTGAPAGPPLPLAKGRPVVFNGQWLVFGRKDGSVGLWRPAAGGRADDALAFQVLSAQFRPDGKAVLTRGSDWSVRLWDADTGKELTPPLRHDAPVLAADFSPDGRSVVTTAAAPPPAPDKGQESAEEKRQREVREIIEKSMREARGLGNPEPPSLGFARVWDAASGAARTPPLPHQLNRPCRLSPDGKLLLTVTVNSARLWDAATGKEVSAPLDHGGAIASAEFSPDGRLVCTVSPEAVRLWGAATGKPVPFALPGGKPVIGAEFSPDGRALLVVTREQGPTGRPAEGLFGAPIPESGSPTAAARLWDVGTARPLTPPLPLAGAAPSAHFSPDGRRLLTLSADGARLWEVATGQPLTPPWSVAAPQGVMEVGGGPERLARAAGYTGPGWDLPADGRPADDWTALGSLLGGRQTDPTGSFVPLDRDVLRVAWAMLRAGSPADFTPASPFGPEWHGRQVAAAEAVKDWNGALWHLERMPARPGQEGNFQAALGQLHLRLGQIEEACACYEKAARSGVQAWEPWYLRGDKLAERGHWDRADADFRRALRVQGAPPGVRMAWAVACLQRGDRDGYRQALGSLLQQFQSPPNPAALRAVLPLTAAAPDTVADPGRLVALAQSLPPQAGDRPGDDLRLQGMVLYRAGRHREAADRFAEALKKARAAQPDYEGTATDWLFLAMAHHQLGDDAVARSWLAKATRWLDNEPQARAAPWGVAVQFGRLRHEAEDLLAKKD
jgi:WD40 repeat protein/tetratricopeptide (TPR) repeat protein